MAVEIAMVDDLVVPLEEAKISAHDRSVYFGDGVYEVVRCSGGKLFEMERHMERLKSSLAKMDMLTKVDLKMVRGRVERAKEEAQIPESLIYFQISRGRAPRSHDYKENWQPGFLLTVRHYKERKEQIKTITHPDWRWKRCDIKSLNLLANVMAKHAAGKAGAYEALLVDEKGLITEATSSTVLMVKGGVLQTTPLTANILPGITRTFILERAGEIGLEVKEESFTVEEVLRADEIIIAGTGAEVMGVTQVDEKIIASGTRGPVTKRMHELLRAAMRGKIPIKR